MSDKKPNLALIIAERMKKGAPAAVESDSDESSHEDMEKSAVSDFIDAVAAKDVDAAHSALRDFVAMVDKDDSEELA